jgi:hypothetical protein
LQAVELPGDIGEGEHHGTILARTGAGRQHSGVVSDAPGGRRRRGRRLRRVS